MEFPSRSIVAADLHRPRYHFLPPANWMNDPNGVIQWKGRYHLFYQHNPTGPLWGNMHWGHAVSDDLIHWDDLPIALAPTPGGPDAAGCFSGCAVKNGVPTLLYTGTVGENNEIQTQCLATSNDDLMTWKKYQRNPIVGIVPPEAGQTQDFRDPFVWKEGETWYMVVGSRMSDGSGVVFLYRSSDLLQWEYLHPLLKGEDKRSGAIWECPNFFQLGDDWVLIVSGHNGSQTVHVYYFVGDYQDQRFTPRYSGTLDYGCLYAPLSFIDDQGRRVLFGWLREERSNRALQAAGWAGVQCIPRVLALDDHKRLLMMPVPELEHIRGRQYHHDSLPLENDLLLTNLSPSLDITVAFELETGGCVGLAFACSPLAAERLELRYDTNDQQLVIRKISPSVDAAGKPLLIAPHPLAAGEVLELRILLDASVIEVIANDRTSISTRFYPSAQDSVCLRVFGERGQLCALDVWEMPSIYGA